MNIQANTNIIEIFRASKCVHWQIIQGEYFPKKSNELLESDSHTHEDALAQLENAIKYLGPGKYTLFYSKSPAVKLEEETESSVRNWKRDSNKCLFSILGSQYPVVPQQGNDSMGAVDSIVEKRVQKELEYKMQMLTLQHEIEKLKEKKSNKKSDDEMPGWFKQLAENPHTGPYIGMLGMNLIQNMLGIKVPGGVQAPAMGRPGATPSNQFTVHGFMKQPPTATATPTGAAQPTTTAPPPSQPGTGAPAQELDALDVQEVQAWVDAMFQLSNNDINLFVSRLTKLKQLAQQPGFLSMLDAQQ